MNESLLLSGSLAALTQQKAAKSGDRIAVQHQDRFLTYSTLHQDARAFAIHLRRQGVQPDDRVVLMLENSIEYVVALFGIWIAGAAAVPINPDTTPGAALQYILSDCAPKGIISRQRIVQRVGLDDSIPFAALFEAEPEQNRQKFFSAAEIDSDWAERPDTALAMVLYTSGTTGRPKGVMLSHRNLLANTRSIVEYLKLTEQDSIVNVLPFFYSFGNSLLLTHLAVGARVVIENRLTFPAKVVETMQRERPTGFSGVPSTYYILLSKTTFAQQDWSFLRYISQAGGGMRVETIQKLRRALPATDIFIMYGQTEAAARLTYLSPELLERKAGSIGRAIPGVEIRVVNEAGHDVRAGESGEIVARGENVMMGYLNNSEATSEALRDGWLWTGDIARTDGDGFVYVVSRKSDFIKSASYRISPAEIEEIIGETEGVEDVAVIGVEDELLGEVIAACIVCSEAKFNVEQLKSHCLERLPLYKTPRYFIRETQIPRTASGKKKYHALREKYRNSDGLS